MRENRAKSWGVGIYIAGTQSVYGKPPMEKEDFNPHKFVPDPEICTDGELDEWLKSCQEWDKNHTEDLT